MESETGELLGSGAAIWSLSLTLIDSSPSISVLLGVSVCLSLCLSLCLFLSLSLTPQGLILASVFMCL